MDPSSSDGVLERPPLELPNTEAGAVFFDSNYFPFVIWRFSFGVSSATAGFLTMTNEKRKMTNGK
jgi:hypothetical protein